jgi:hypothetical protein
MQVRLIPTALVAVAWGWWVGDTGSDMFIRTFFMIGFSYTIQRAVEVWRGSV